MVIFKGRPEMARARKKDLKPKKKADDKPSQEIIDQMRYLGGKVFDMDPNSNSSALVPIGMSSTAVALSKTNNTTLAISQQ
jgi:hypothetical protein